MNYWLVKTEPNTYSWDDFVSKGVDRWDGVRNYQARNNLRSMKLDDLVFFYHSRQGLEIVGLAKVVTESYPDPSANDNKWVSVDFEAIKNLKKTVSLEEIKADPELSNMVLVKNSRLSVMPITEFEFKKIMQIAHEK